jgi:hypothetical protein
MLCERSKAMRGVQNLEGGVAENGDFRQGGQDALYPALSGEWEAPVTRTLRSPQ